jgi:hypothetical protein
MIQKERKRLEKHKKLPGCLDYGRVMFVSHKKIALIIVNIGST